MVEAAARWRRDLESWAIPEEILRAAPESPWGFPPRLFTTAAEAALEDAEPTPSRRRALEALPPGGTVLDVGAGGGAASLPLAPPAGRLVAVDESPAMLEAFAAAAERRHVPHDEIQGRWPDVEASVGGADVVVCHHVVYNVADLVPFLLALSSHARRRVVVEMTKRHPLTDMAPLWSAFHGVERPSRPTYEGAVEVANELGYVVEVDCFERNSLWDRAPEAERVAFLRRQLCVGPERDADIAAYLARRSDGGRPLVTLSWEPPG